MKYILSAKPLASHPLKYVEDTIPYLFHVDTCGYVLTQMLMYTDTPTGHTNTHSFSLSTD